MSSGCRAWRDVVPWAAAGLGGSVSLRSIPEQCHFSNLKSEQEPPGWVLKDLQIGDTCTQMKVWEYVAHLGTPGPAQAGSK